MRKIVHITGARPNFPKLAPVVKALSEYDIEQVVIHTGQHYDDKMSDVFFRELDLPRPDFNLGVGSGTHAVQTGEVMRRLEEKFADLEPAMVLVYGDINSTLAAALVASKAGIPLAHVEAGLRSFDMTMPEEVNRLVTDRLADLLLATSVDAVAHLASEGVHADKIEFVGNPMIDTLLSKRDAFDADAAREAHSLTGDYMVATLHRPANVDNDDRVKQLVRVLHQLADIAPVVLPLHPRGRERLEACGLLDHRQLRVIEPIGYVDFLSLVSGASAVVTDSGGVQEETTVLGVPCLTLRPNTERPVTITHGTNQLVTLDNVVDRATSVVEAGRSQTWPVPPLWDGHAGERIATAVMRAVALEDSLRK